MIRGIVLIVIDCLRADHVSCLGYSRPTTPTLDALVPEGILFEQAHSVSSWTKPSVASLPTGLYPSCHGAFQGIKRSKGRTATTDILQSTQPTLAEHLSLGGWRCGAFINNAQLSPYTQLNRGASERSARVVTKRTGQPRRSSRCAVDGGEHRGIPPASGFAWRGGIVFRSSLHRTRLCRIEHSP